jgi:hypothetical protein
MIGRVFLGLQAIIFIPYGLYCLVAPESLAAGAGVVATSTTGTIELQTMYGGLQVAVGVMCAVALLRRGFEPVALYALLFVFAGLAVVRVSLGLMHGDMSGYTLFAMIYETACLLFLAWYLLLKNAAPLEHPGQR